MKFLNGPSYTWAVSSGLVCFFIAMTNMLAFLADSVHVTSDIIGKILKTGHIWMDRTLFFFSLKWIKHSSKFAIS